MGVIEYIGAVEEVYLRRTAIVNVAIIKLRAGDGVHINGAGRAIVNLGIGHVHPLGFHGVEADNAAPVKAASGKRDIGAAIKPHNVARARAGFFGVAEGQAGERERLEQFEKRSTST